MPELPEVETIAAALRDLIEGAVIRAAWAGPRRFVRFDPGASLSDLEGRGIGAVTRRGKRLTIELRPKGLLVCHLGMTGRINVVDASSPLFPHTHLRLTIDDGAREVRFRDPRRFGGVWVSRSNETSLPALGPDALDITAAEFRTLFDRPRGVKALLLDQRRVCGLGNIYCDEGLFAAGIHPRTKSSRLSAERVDRLHAELVRILEEAIRHRGSTLRDYTTVEGGSGSFQFNHLVYGREGLPCVRCDSAIRRILVAGRSTHLCPRCQRAPTTRITKAARPEVARSRATREAPLRRRSESRRNAPSRVSSPRPPRRRARSSSD